MRKSIKKVVVLFIIVLSVFQIPIRVFATNSIPSATSDFYVNDFAGVFSSEEKKELINNAVALAEEHDGIQVVITTIKSLDGNSIENYTLNMYNQYEIGKDDMGILILLVTEDRQIRVEVGNAMEAYITDSKAGRFMDSYAIPSLKENKFNEGLINLQEAFITEIVSCIEEENSQVTENVVSSNSKVKDRNWHQILPSVFGFIAILLFIVLVVYAIYKIIQKSRKTKETIQHLTNQLKETKQSSIKQREEFLSEISSLRHEYAEEKANLIESSHRRNEELSLQCDKKITSFKEEIHSLSKQKDEISMQYQTLQNDYAVLKDRYERVNKLHPNADEEVTAMIEEEIRQQDMKKAHEVDELIAGVITLTASKDIVESLNSVLHSYHSLEEKQKAYVTSNVEQLRNLYNTSVRLKEEYEQKMEEERIRKQIEEDKNAANNAMQSIQSIVSAIHVGTAQNLSKLQEAKNIYERLTKSSRKYFDNSLLDKLKHSLDEAEKDFAREQKIAKNKKIAATAIASITAIIGYMSYGKARDLRKLKEAKDIYENLNSDAREYVDQSVMDKLDRLMREAKRDKEKEEEEERRRRQREEEEHRRRQREEEHRRRMQSSSYSGFGGSSHYGGFGGHSGGGGASRGF